MIGISILLLFATCAEPQISTKAKAAFAFADVSLCKCKNCTCKDCKCTDGKCVCKNCCRCQNCNCKDCKCKNGECKCKDCNSFDAVYAKAIKDSQPVVIEVGEVVHLTDTPWRIIQVKSITDEKSGYIVGVPKNGELVRLDFAPGTSRERIRLDILHVLYPLTDGYVECPVCPEGRIRNGR